MRGTQSGRGRKKGTSGDRGGVGEDYEHGHDAAHSGLGSQDGHAGAGHLLSLGQGAGALAGGMQGAGAGLFGGDGGARGTTGQYLVDGQLQSVDPKIGLDDASKHLVKQRKKPGPKPKEPDQQALLDAG